MDNRLKLVIFLVLFLTGVANAQTRGALVKNGVVVNVVVVGDPVTWVPPVGTVFVPSDSAELRDTYDGTDFTNAAPLPEPRNFKAEYVTQRGIIPAGPIRDMFDLLAEKIGIRAVP